MKPIPSFSECINLLIEYSIPDQIISHLLFTAQTAMMITRQLKKKKIVLDCDLILAGALLHDIGRSKSHNIDHGIVGAEILRTGGFPDELVSIVEKHIYAGISKQEAKELGLPYKDYIPETYEEKIVAYADNVSKTNKIQGLEEVIKRFKRYLPETHSILIRVKELHAEFDILVKK